MKNMKKILVSLLVLCLAFGTVACGSSSDEGANADSNTTVADVAGDNETAEEPETVAPETSEEVEGETEEVVENVEVEDVENVEDVEDVEENVETTITYTYADVSQTMYVKSAVNVRDLPSTSGNRLGSLAAAQEVTVTGKCNETGWYRIAYGDKVAYVSNNYLLTEMPVAEVVAETETTLEKCPYLLWELYYDEPSDSIYFCYIEGSEACPYYYYYACDMIRQYSSTKGEIVSESYELGIYQEGDIRMARIYIYPC